MSPSVGVEATHKVVQLHALPTEMLSWFNPSCSQAPDTQFLSHSHQDGVNVQKLMG